MEHSVRMKHTKNEDNSHTLSLFLLKII